MENKITVHVAAVAWPHSPGHAAFGWTIERNGIIFKQASMYVGAKTTIDTAEYSGIAAALTWTARVSKFLRVQKNPIRLTLIPMVMKTSNPMIANQLNGLLKVKPPFGPMCMEVKSLMEIFRIIEIRHVTKDEPEPAAKLARGVLDDMGYRPGPN